MEKEQNRQYWTYAPGENAWCWNNKTEDITGLKGDFALGIMGMGFFNNEKYNFNNEKEILETLKTPENDNPSKTANLIWDFYKNVAIGDVVFARNGKSKLLSHGIVKSDYYFTEKRKEHRHVHDVEWYEIASEDGVDLGYELGRFTFSKTGKHLEALKELCNLDDSTSSERKVKDIVKIESDKKISETEKERLIATRLGQGKFKQDVRKIEKGGCRVTGVDDIDFLMASHIKPWCKCTHEERLDKYNGLLLSPHIDKLFDRGYISFEDNGDMLVSEKANQVIGIWNIHIKNVGTFHSKQKEYLKWHREKVYNKRNEL